MATAVICWSEAETDARMRQAIRGSLLPLMATAVICWSEAETDARSNEPQGELAPAYGDCCDLLERSRDRCA